MIDPTAETTEIPHVPERPEPVACPWCGGSTQVGDKYFGAGSRKVFFVYCDDHLCSAIGPCRPTPEEAVDAWDRVARPAHEAPEAARLAQNDFAEMRARCRRLDLVEAEERLLEDRQGPAAMLLQEERDLMAWITAGEVPALLDRLDRLGADIKRAEHAFEHHYRVGQMEDGSGWYVYLRGAAVAVGGWDGEHLHPTWSAAIDTARRSEAQEPSDG